MSEHARLSPSDKAWPHCPGSVRENAAYPDIPGDAAIDGTGSHLLLELCLTNRVPALHYDQQLIGMNHPDQPGGWLVGIERCERVQQCLDYVARRVGELKQQFPGCKTTVESESQSNPGALIGRQDWWGTCDITITVTNAHGFCVYLEVIDYKDGRGWVDVNDNTQLQSYLFGKMRPFIGSGPEFVAPFHPERIYQVRQTIVQPRCNPTVRDLVLTGEEAFESFGELSRAAHATDWPDAPLVPDDKGGKGHCRWCKHGRAGNCQALNNTKLQEANSMSSDLITTTGSEVFQVKSVEEIKAMSDDTLAKLYDTKAPILQVFAHVEEEIERRVTTNGMNGFAMEPSRGSRVWAQKEDAIVKALKAKATVDGKRLRNEDIYVTKLISPAQILECPKLSTTTRKNIESELVTFKAGANKLTRIAYKRKTLSAEEMFGSPVPDFSGNTESAPDFSGAVVKQDPPNFF